MNTHVQPLFADIINRHAAPLRAANDDSLTSPLLPFRIRIVSGQCRHEYDGMFPSAIDASIDGRHRVGLAGKVTVEAI